MTRYKLSVKYDPNQPRDDHGRWTSTGGMIPRTAMPQILSKDLPNFYAYAESKGVRVTSERVKAKYLQFRQAVDKDHAAAIPKAALDKPILISSDNYVLDGNHRAAANAALGRMANVRRVPKPFREAIDFMFTYPGVLNLEQAQEARKYDPSQPRAPAGSPNGGQWVADGGGQYTMGFSGVQYSNKFTNQVLGIEGVTADAPGDLDNGKGRESEPAGWHAYAALMADREAHQDAQDFTPGIHLYQATYYQNYNYALRHPGEAEMFDGLFHNKTNLPDYEDDWDNTRAAEEAWEESGMADATGKSADQMYSLSDFSGSLYLAEDMAGALERYAPRLPNGIRLYRAFRNQDLYDNPEKYIGKTFTEEGFSSTTVSAQFANKWGSVRKNRIIMRGTTDGTQRGLHLLGTNYNGGSDPYEFEVLLAPGTDYRVRSATRTANGDLIVDVDITTPGASEPNAPRVGVVNRSDKETVELGEPNPDKFIWDEESCERMFARLKFDPNQPRHPAGHPQGGQWTTAGGSSAGGTSDGPRKGNGEKGGNARQDRREKAREEYDAERRARSRDGEAWAYAGRSEGDGESLRGVIATYEPTPELQALMKKTGLVAPTLLELDPTPENAAAYEKAIRASKEASPYGAAVYIYPTDEYTGMRLFVTPDRKSGLAIKSDGDIVSAFSDGGGKVHAMLSLAVEQGGSKLDAFDTVLPDLYAVNGFKEVGRDSWNDDYKPSDWSYETFSKFNNGRPDVVYMEYDPEYSAYAGRRKAAYKLTVRYNPSQPRDKIGRWTSGYHSGVQVGVGDILKGDGRYVYANLPKHANPEKLLGQVLEPVKTTTSLNEALVSHSPGNTLVRIEGVEPGGTAVVTHVIERGKWGMRGDVVLYATSPEMAKKYDPGQPRVPAGSSDGGRWTTDGVWMSNSSYRNEIQSGNLPDKYELHAELLALPHHKRWAAESAALHAYQGIAYREMNAVLRYPKEAEDFKNRLQGLRKTGHFYEHSYLEEEWAASGMLKATGREWNRFNMTRFSKEEVHRDAKNLRDWMAETAPEIGKDLTVYRAFRDASINGDPAALIGKEWVEKGFSSTTIDPSFVVGWSDPENRVILRAKLPKTTRGMYLARRNNPEEYYEGEVLLPAGARYKITRALRDPSGTVLLDAVVVQD